MPQVGDIWESYRANEFVLRINGTVSPGVSKITGLSEGEIETIEQPVGASSHVYKLAGSKVKYEPLTIERYVDGSPQDKLFQEWFAEVFSLNATTQGGSGARRSGMIEKWHNGEKVLTFMFLNAWIKSSKFTDLEAGSTALFKQTIVLEHEGLERVD
ncbi:MAG TPA: phage tail protein [Acidimicrobiales bacterium]|jgi:phage tail-like protein